MSNKRKKVNFKEEETKGPFGVGDDFEEVSKLNIFEHLSVTGQLEDITQDLDEKQKEYVIKEAKMHSDQYQKVLEHVSNILSTPDGKKLFREMILKKAGQR